MPDQAESAPVMTNSYLFLVIAIGAVCGMFSLNVAESKGHSPVAWFFAGFLFGPIGLISACGLGDKRMSRTLRRIAESQKVGDLPVLEFEDDD
tara:strand:- start:222 stop:500 length:279 start_codon:yes stop_codon:yes gene_type:complete